MKKTGLEILARFGVDGRVFRKEAATFPDLKIIIHNGISKNVYSRRFYLTNFSNNVNSQTSVEKHLVSML